MRQGSHSDTLHPQIMECLNQTGLKISDVDLFASGIGPGSFTGIRVSLNAIKTYGYINQKFCLALDTLSNLALQAHHKNPGLGPILTIVNAFKNMVYFAEFESSKDALKTIKVAQAIHVRDFINQLPHQALCLGDGFPAYENYLVTHAQKKLVRSTDFSDFPLASSFALDSMFVKKVTWQDLFPIYLRASEAEENLQGIKFSPL